MSTPPTVRVLLVDDDAHFAATWAELLGGIFVVATVPDIDAARRAIWRNA
ncbi:MAG: hypothetical protein R6X25_15210 [Candidatus Krumholzibacteriia bacterium]